MPGVSCLHLREADLSVRNILFRCFEINQLDNRISGTLKNTVQMH